MSSTPTETIPCPKHGRTPAVRDTDGFLSCRACWYPRFICAVLRYGWRRA